MGLFESKMENNHFPEVDMKQYDIMRSVLVSEEEQKNIDEWLKYLDMEKKYIDLEILNVNCEDAITFERFFQGYVIYTSKPDKVILAKRHEGKWYIVSLKQKEGLRLLIGHFL